MKKFHFSLAAALKLRDSQLQAERTKLQQLFAEEQGFKDALERIAADRREAAAFIQDSGAVTATDLRALSTFSMGADTREAHLRGQLLRQAKHIQEQKARVMQAERKVRLLTKLREKKLDAWTQELNREIELAAQESWLSKRHVEVSRQRASLTPTD
jgi:flagellar export protein FliJ